MKDRLVADEDELGPCPRCGTPLRDTQGDSWPWCPACGWPDEDSPAD